MEIVIKVYGKMIKPMDLVSLHIRMDQFFKVNFKMA